MEFDEYEYLEKTVENPELQRKEKTNGSDITVKAEERDHSRSSKHKANEKHDDVDRHSKKLKSGDDSHGYDSHKERGSSWHRSPSRDGDKEKDRHGSIHDNRGRVRDQDRVKRDRHQEHDRDRERDKRDRGSESGRERERDHSRRSRIISERHQSDLDERDRDYRDGDRERERESRERDRDTRYGRATFRWSFWQLGQSQNLRSWVSKFLPSGMYLKACIAGLGGFGFFVTAMTLLSCYLFSSSLSTIALLHLFCCRMLVRE